MINIKTSKKLLTSVWQIGNYIITIHTSQKIGPLPFHWVPAQEGIGIVPISIYLEENETLKEQVIHFCKERGIFGLISDFMGIIKLSWEVLVK